MRRTTATLTAATLITLLLTGCSDTDNGSDSAQKNTSTTTSTPRTPTAAPTPDTSRDAKITKAGVENHQVWGPDAYVVHYTITNSGAEAADYFVQLEFLDRDGDVLGTTGVTADKLGPGKTHTGDTAPLEAEIQNGAMTDITDVRVSQVERTPIA